MANKPFENDNTEEIWWAPVEIEHSDQLKTLHATKEDCKTWRIGNEKVIVYLVPSNKETYDFLLGELRKKHRNGFRSVRCQIPGTRKALIFCPDSNSCAHCPFGRKPENRDPNLIDWESYVKAGCEYTPYDSTAESALTRAEYSFIRALMEREDPRIATAFEMRKFGGFDVEEISAMLGVSAPRVYQLIKRGEQIYIQYNNA